MGGTPARTPEECQQLKLTAAGWLVSPTVETALPLRRGWLNA